ncbi:MAG: virulence RhuM family protein, partial [Bacteroidales bacterium]|nr:virulence RhuM family protein [Bacteroidales bacterium]
DTLNRLVTIFLEDAELRVKERKDLTIKYWKESVDDLLKYRKKKVLSGKGSISNQQAEDKAREEYGTFDARRKQFEALKADQDDIKELEDLASTKR